RLEELRAEMTAMILGHALGLGNDPSLRNSEAYVEHWIQGLENHPETIRTIAGDAQAISEWLTRGLDEETAAASAPAA
ncbi:MAG: zincin-like metallopeptidase domain-containing protein, partial [Acidobacteria bacterium]|nr:zincin-like metallopeptidase domain-containing protein [Acidobacteriota bacterium]